VLVFSHGLGGSYNTYSYLLGSLASCGVVCIAPEHRDQSAPISIIQKPDGTSSTVKYKALSHEPSPEVLRARNAQFGIRLWELELLYTALSDLNDGREHKNLVDADAPSLKNQLDLRPSRVTWAGHSFGAATMVQFLKSVFWHQSVPNGNADSRSLKLERLYSPSENSALQQQITAKSPLALLDLWTMPLRGDETKWLWERPLPCYASGNPATTNVLAIMSETFQKWTTILERTKAVLSQEPAKAEMSSRSSTLSSHQPLLFYAPKTAHLSQSDFCILFPWLTKRWMGAEEPERTLLLNTRAILQLLRENRISVESVKLKDSKGLQEPTLDDAAVLARDGNIQGWVHLPID
jgi:platelet-activating factor acetylhydrolase